MEWILLTPEAIPSQMHTTFTNSAKQNIPPFWILMQCFFLLQILSNLHQITLSFGTAPPTSQEIWKWHFSSMINSKKHKLGSLDSVKHKVEWYQILTSTILGIGHFYIKCYILEMLRHIIVRVCMYHCHSGPELPENSGVNTTYWKKK